MMEGAATVTLTRATECGWCGSEAAWRARKIFRGATTTEVFGWTAAAARISLSTAAAAWHLGAVAGAWTQWGARKPTGWPTSAVRSHEVRARLVMSTIRAAR